MFKAEKEQASGMVSLFYGMVIAVAVGAVFMLLFPEVAEMIGDNIKSKFTSLLGMGLPYVFTLLK